VSDLHLGKSDSQYKKFLELLKSEKPDELYLIGDIFDLWVKNFKYIREKCCDFFNTLEEFSINGTKIFYILGNHDFDIDLQKDPIFDKMSICIEKKLNDTILFHGHQYDFLMVNYFYLVRFLTFIYSLFNSKYETSLASKRKDKEFDFLLNDIKNKAVQENKDFKTIIMGHTHIADDCVIDNVRYINLGDWVTNLTYAIEIDGIIELKRSK
jgi:UDP-2,3-diacylglucosamine hydrolase